MPTAPKRRYFPEALKQDAVTLLELGKTVNDIADELGVRPDYIKRWWHSLSGIPNDFDSKIDLWGTKEPLPPKLIAFARQYPQILESLTPREEVVLRLRWGIENNPTSLDQIAPLFGVTRERVRQIIRKGVRKLNHPSRAQLIEQLIASGGRQLSHNEIPLAVQDVIETILHLTPQLMAYLKKHREDLDRLKAEVFEQLVAELLAGFGYKVALVGRNPLTSADIFAISQPDSLRIQQHYFVEVKRWRERIGVQVIDRVYGAMLAERDVHGWSGALIVSLLGFADFHKYDRTLVCTRGIHLRDREDLLHWLEDYRPHSSGLWLPRQTFNLDELK